MRVVRWGGWNQEEVGSERLDYTGMNIVLKLISNLILKNHPPPKINK